MTTTQVRGKVSGGGDGLPIKIKIIGRKSGMVLLILQKSLG